MANKKAFTLIEIMVVVVIVGLVSAFAIPSYGKAIDKALARQMYDNLQMIAAAQESYLAANGSYFGDGSGTSTQAQLDTALGLKIISQKGVVYACQFNTASPAVVCDCTADYPTRWTYTISTSAVIIPKWSQITCSSGTCPVGVP